MADFKKKAVIPKKVPIPKTGVGPSVSAGIGPISMGPFKDLVTCEEMLNQNTTWADPDPFVQLDQKNPGKKIGVANPYVLASIVLNRTINWNKVNAKDILREAFVPTGSNFADIFNPEKSPIFYPKKINGLLTADMFSVSGGTGQGSGAHTGSGAPATPGRTAKFYDPITPSRDHLPPGAPPGSTVPTSLPFKKANYGNIKDVLDDSMQGACVNCYFIAALYSRAWCSYPAFPPTPPTSPPCTNGSNITFYTTTCGSVTKCATPTFPVDDYKQPVFAQMTTDWELWSALYEKAYAMFLNLYPPPDLPNHTSTDPNIGGFQEGDPLLSLFHITKMKWDFTSSNTIAQPSAFLTKELSLFNFTSSYEALKKNLTAKINSSQKTINPTVAWTYDMRVESLPPCSSDLFEEPGPYGDDLIVPNHSYSILGSITINNENYIVLRNPWGANWFGNDPQDPVKPYLAAGDWKPVTGVTITLGSRTDGVFGLKTNAFDCCFRGFGWVQFRCV